MLEIPKCSFWVKLTHACTHPALMPQFFSSLPSTFCCWFDPLHSLWSDPVGLWSHIPLVISASPILGSLFSRPPFGVYLQKSCNENASKWKSPWISLVVDSVLPPQPGNTICSYWFKTSVTSEGKIFCIQPGCIQSYRAGLKWILLTILKLHDYIYFSWAALISA